MTIQLFLMAMLFVPSFRTDSTSLLIGCFRDTDDRDLSGYAFHFTDNTPGKCIGQCKARGFLYAGLQNVFSCYCGLEYGKHGKLNVGVCTQRCPGDSGFYCGAQMANLVYGTRLLSLDNMYVGCYGDNIFNRAMKEFAIYSLKDLTPEKCHEICWIRGYLYFGLQEGEDCYCDNVYDRHGVKDTKYCNSPCTGNGKTMCGGHLKTTVYRTGIVLPDITTYIGCFSNDKRTSGFVKTINHSTIISKTDDCIKECRKQGYEYAGLKENGVCSCADVYIGKHKQQDEHVCTYPCAWDHNRKCGGKKAINIYNTGFLKTHYFGCFKDRRGDERDVRLWSTTNDTHMDIRTCMKECHSKCKLSICSVFFK